MNIISLFSGAGGLDLGFKAAGFKTIWANEYDKDIWETFEKNFPGTTLDRRSITEIPEGDVPECDGIIGGPPCQSWSEAGALRGINDKRGKLFYDYVRLLNAKKPKFFLAENVSGMLAPRHAGALQDIKQLFAESRYDLHFTLLNAKNYGVPQDRKRVFFIGFRKDLKVSFKFPEPSVHAPKLAETISELADSAIPGAEKNHTNGDSCHVPNHEYLTGGFSSIYMSRNRVRSYEEQSFTIQAGARHAPLHPQAPKMELIGKDKRAFVKGQESLYRRLSVRECARIQTFPDDHVFHYSRLADGYKMVGNAVPCKLAECLAAQIYSSLNAAAQPHLNDKAA